jgi:hypothetical protein
MALAAQQQKAIVKNLTEVTMVARDQHGGSAAGPGLHNFLNMRKSSTAKFMPSAGVNASAIFGSTVLRQADEMPLPRPVPVLGHEDEMGDHVQVSGSWDRYSMQPPFLDAFYSSTTTSCKRLSV